ncbi:DUF6710 family protein [Pseudomonas sp. 8Z]|uniref:DUF6710 family protein n=1 Tax=Pseudomonas sp. 8Z TaxID=2653166 RepID=UPI003558A368
MWWKRGRGDESPRSQFECLMKWADELVAKRNAEGLHDLVKIVLRPIQARHMREAYLKPENHGPDSLWWPLALGFSGLSQKLDSDVVSYINSHCLVSCVAGKETLNLASDVVLPTAWHPTSLVAKLGAIGLGLPEGEFEQSTNHRVCYMYPLGIGWVGGGNHSISQGIVRGEVTLAPTEYLDITPVLHALRYDGDRWRCVVSGRTVGKPCYPEFGWAWELTRKALELGAEC